MITITDLPLADAKLFTLNKLGDNRGWFVETFRKSWVEEFIGKDIDFKFDYSSCSHNTNTLRGMHAQTREHPQRKLVSVLRGSIQDIIIDARQDSPTYGKSCDVILSDKQPQVLYVPIGFYHGFKTLERDTMVSYKLDGYYNAAAECGVMWHDTDLDLKWRNMEGYTLTISERDQRHPLWANAYKF